MSTNYSPGIAETRRANRERFAAFITPYIDAFGGPTAVAAHLGVKTPRTVTAWTLAETVPNTERLLVLAEMFDIDPHVMLDIAGKPPIVELRHAMATDHDATLPGALKAFQEANSLDGTAAAEHFGIDRYSYARFAAGSAQPTSLSFADRLARGLGISIDEVLDLAAVGAHAPIRDTVRRGTSGVVGMIRDTIEAAGIHSWTTDGARQGAKLLSIPVSRMTSYLSGSRTPDLLDCQRLANAGPHALDELLVAAGFDTDDAQRLADAVRGERDARAADIYHGHKDQYLSVGEILKAYRITADLSQHDVAKRVGFRQHTAVVKIETGTSNPSLRSLLAVTEVLDAPLGRVLAAAGLIA